MEGSLYQLSLIPCSSAPSLLLLLLMFIIALFFPGRYRAHSASDPQLVPSVPEPQFPHLGKGVSAK